jgi:hypothetical protein
MALMLCGVADAATLCREGAVPSSKIYLAMEKLAKLGLVQVQPTRPKMFAALPPDVVVARAVDIARDRAERFAATAPVLASTFAGLRSRARGRQPFVDLALGVDGHVRRHLVPLAAARQRILSYLEHGDLVAIDTAIAGGFPILRRIAKNTAEHKVRHQVVFGFSSQTARTLVDFLKRHRQDLRQVTGVRYSGELGHPFHVIDDEMVVLPRAGLYAIVEQGDAEPARSGFAEEKRRKRLAERVGVFEAVSENLNEYGLFRHNARGINDLASSSIFLRLRLFASVFRFSQRNDTRNDTRRERLPRSPRRRI